VARCPCACSSRRVRLSSWQSSSFEDPPSTYEQTSRPARARLLKREFKLNLAFYLSVFLFPPLPTFIFQSHLNLMARRERFCSRSRSRPLEIAASFNRKSRDTPRPRPAGKELRDPSRPEHVLIDGDAWATFLITKMKHAICVGCTSTLHVPIHLPSPPTSVKVARDRQSWAESIRTKRPLSRPLPANHTHQ